MPKQKRDYRKEADEARSNYYKNKLLDIADILDNLGPRPKTGKGSQEMKDYMDKLREIRRLNFIVNPRRRPDFNPNSKTQRKKRLTKCMQRAKEHCQYKTQLHVDKELYEAQPWLVDDFSFGLRYYAHK